MTDFPSARRLHRSGIWSGAHDPVTPGQDARMLRRTRWTGTLCRALRDDYSVEMTTSDIRTREDAEQACGRAGAWPGCWNS